MPSPDPTFRKTNVMLGLDPDHHKKVKKYRVLNVEDLKCMYWLIPLIEILVIFIDKYIVKWMVTTYTEHVLFVASFYVIIVFFTKILSKPMIYVDKTEVDKEYWVYHEDFDTNEFKKEIGVTNDK